MTFTMVAPKPDCTGERFGYLTVLRKNGTLWDLKCDCGKVVSLKRGDFDRKGKGQISCGCLHTNKRRKELNLKPKREPYDLTDRKFGNLTAVKLTGRKDKSKKPTWLLKCDCGNYRELSYSKLGNMVKHGYRINCGNREKHIDRYLEYPPMPVPMPYDVGQLLVKYFKLVELPYSEIKSDIEDEKRDRLIRACWIVTYRRQIGEFISKEKESNLIKKHLRYCSIDAYRKSKNLGMSYNKNVVFIGDVMTNATLPDYPVLETPGKNMLPKKRKHFKFKRC